MASEQETNQQRPDEEFCQYCGRVPANGQAAIVYLYRVKSKIRYPLSTHFNYEYLKLTLPRCLACQTSHQAGLTQAKIVCVWVILGCVGAGIAMGALMSGLTEDSPWGILGGLFYAMIVLVGAYTFAFLLRLIRGREAASGPVSTIAFLLRLIRGSKASSVPKPTIVRAAILDGWQYGNVPGQEDADRE